MKRCCCPCHEQLTLRESRALAWSVLNGMTLAQSALVYGVTTLRAREILAALCYEANPTLYEAHCREQVSGPTLGTLRRHRAAFGFGDGV